MLAPRGARPEWVNGPGSRAPRDQSVFAIPARSPILAAGPSGRAREHSHLGICVALQGGPIHWFLRSCFVSFVAPFVNSAFSVTSLSSTSVPSSPS